MDLDNICGYCGESDLNKVHDHWAEIQAEQMAEEEEYLKDYLNR